MVRINVQPTPSPTGRPAAQRVSPATQRRRTLPCASYLQRKRLSAMGALPYSAWAERALSYISAFSECVRVASQRRPNPDRFSADPFHALQTFPNAAGCTPWERRTAWIYPYAIYNEVPSRPRFPAATKRPAPTARAAAAPAPPAGQLARGRRSGYGATQVGRGSARNRRP